MSNLSHPRAAARLALLGALGAAAVGPAVAHGATVVQASYTCPLPFGGSIPLVVQYSTAITGRAIANYTNTFTITAVGVGTPLGGTPLGDLTGTGTAAITVSQPTFTGSATSQTTAAIDLVQGNGANPTIGLHPTPIVVGPYRNSGSASIAATTIDLNLSANGQLIDEAPGVLDSDGDPTTFDVICTPDAGPSLTLAAVNVVLEDANGLPTPTAAPVSTDTPTPTPTPTATPRPTPTSTSYARYAVKGAATLKTLVKGSVPLAGTLTWGSPVDAQAAGGWTANLGLGETTANLTVLGFLPVKATVDLVPTAPVTGTVGAPGTFSATARERIKLPAFSVLGVPVGGGANCQSAQVSTIPLAAVGPFSYDTGGTIAGTFAISNLTGCGALNGLVSPLTSGNGNTIALTLTRSTDLVVQ